MKNKEVSQEAVLENFDEMAPQESRGKKIINIIINVILVISIIVAAVCTYVSFVSTSGNGVPSVLGARIFSIQTESMYPTLEPGDLIIDTAIKDTSELEVGDVITYWTVINGERVLNTHRIVEIYDGGGHLIFETRGDNNAQSDPLTVHESELVGQYNGLKVSGLGKVFDYLQTSTGFLIVVVIPVAIFFLYHLVQFFRVLFEYNNIKNRLLYEMERGKNEEANGEEKKKLNETRRKERERLENELREKLKAEILAANTAAAAVEEQPAPEPEKTPEEIAAEQRAALEAEIRAQILAEMEAKTKAEAEANTDF